MTLLKGLALYRAILRQHRQTLPPHLKQLGDQYVRAEFRLHRSAKPDILMAFNEEWNNYLLHLRTPAAKIGANLAEEAMQDFAPHQHEQLSKLKGEAVKAARAGDAEEGEGQRKGPPPERPHPVPSKLG